MVSGRCVSEIFGCAKNSCFDVSLFAPRTTTMVATAMSASTAALRASVIRRAPRGRAMNTTPRAFFGGAKPAVAAGPLHDFTVMDIDKKPVELSKFAGKAVLIVNVASA